MKISVVIPSFNSRDSLQVCLLSLKHQTVAPPHDFEVIVVDDGSSDGTEEMVAGLRLDFELRYHYKPRTDESGRAAARNTGIELSRGDLVVFIDADEVVPPGFLDRQVNAHLHATDLVLLGARAYMHGGDVDLELLSRTFTFDALPPVSGQDPRETIFEALSENLSGMATRWHYAFSCNLSVRRAHLIAVGGFDDGFRGWGLEDSELGYRLHRAGLSFAYDPEAVLYHQHHEFSQEEHYADWKRNLTYFCSKHADLEAQLQWVMDLFFDPEGQRVDWLECCLRFEYAVRAVTGRLPVLADA